MPNTPPKSVSSVEGDNLPQLKPADPTDFANLPLATPIVSEASGSEAVPIGTAILRDLQASSDTTLQVTPTASEAIADERSLSPANADSSPALVATLPAVQASGYSTAPDGSTPNNSIHQAEPTLDGRLQTMPPRTEAPLVVRDQANRESSQLLPTELPIVWRSNLSPLAESPIETANPAAVQPSQPQVIQAPPTEFKFEPSLRADDGQASTNATNSPSPLLAGLELERDPDEMALSAMPSLTVYVPIAEAPQADELRTLILPIYNWANHELAPSPFPLTSKASLYEKTLLPRKHFVQNSVSRS